MTVAEHIEIVNHVRECIKLRNIQVKIRRTNTDINFTSNEDLADNNQSILARTQIARKLENFSSQKEKDQQSTINGREHDTDCPERKHKIVEEDSGLRSLKRPASDTPILLDVFVIGSNAQCQLERFFKLTNIHPHNQNNLKLILSTTAGQCQKNLENLTDNTETLLERPDQLRTNNKEDSVCEHSLEPTSFPDRKGQTMLDNQFKQNLELNEAQKLISSSELDPSKDEQKVQMQHKTKTNQPDEINSSKPDQLENITSLGLDNSGQSRDDIIQVHSVSSQAPSDLCNVAKRLIENLDEQISELTRDSNLLHLLAIYQTIISATHTRTLKKPLLNGLINADETLLSDLLLNVSQFLRVNSTYTGYEHIVAELLSILCGYELEAICSAYDQLARLLEYEQISDITKASEGKEEHETRSSQDICLRNQASNYDDLDERNQQAICKQNSQVLAPIRGETKGLVRTVHIDKSSNKALGATIKNEGSKVVIGRVVYGGLAQKSGLLQEGDEILEVNGISMHGKNINQVVELIQVMDGTLSLTLKIKEFGPGKPLQDSIESNSNKNNKRQMTSNNMNIIDIKGNANQVVINENLNGQQDGKLFVRAFFDFDGQHDEFIPCKELALSFQKGEILCIIDRSDKTWWQANRQLDEPSDECSFQLAGLIPSLSNVSHRNKSKDLRLTKTPSLDESENADCYAHKRQSKESNATPETVNYYSDDDYDILETKKNLVSRLFNCPTSVVPAKRRAPQASSQANVTPTTQLASHKSHHVSLRQILMSNQGFNLIEQIPLYEEVELFYPKQNAHLKRPIIFVGPKMIGQRDLINRLISNEPARFASPISHTTRQKLPNERDGLDFHFVTRETFESDMSSGKFIECGQFQGQYYGTSFEAISRIVKSGKTCLHLISIPSIFNFHHGRASCELKPFFVFVKPKNCNDKERLRNLIATYSLSSDQRKQQHHSRINSINRSEMENSVCAIIEEVKLVESHLLAYFDLVIDITRDIDRVQKELMVELDKIQDEPQWIPKFWSSKWS